MPATFPGSGMKGVESCAWYGFFAPARTPADVVAKLEATAFNVVTQPEWQKILADSGSEYVGDPPGQFAAFTRAEAARWAKVVKDSCATVD